ncbi:MAG: lipid A deacylase LpxR family protein [Acidobacteriota bacterium]
MDAISHRFCFGLVLCSLVLTSGAAPAVAKDPCSETDDNPWASWQFQEENDFLSGEDDFYTQGLLFTVTRCRDRTPEWAEELGQWLWSGLYSGRESSVVFSLELGQYIFTPEDLSRPELIVDDRPYAGYLFGGVVLTVTEDGTENPVQQIFELQLGVIGPESGAEWAQEQLHELINSQPPMGWENQLPFEVGLEFIYRWQRRIGSSTFDVVPHVGGGLGNLQVFANLGATFRLGKNLESTFPVRINVPTRSGRANGGARGAEDTRATLDAGNRATRGADDNGATLDVEDFVAQHTANEAPKWDGFLFVGADGRFVGRNIFLDGSTFEGSHSVDREPFVTDLSAGFSFRYGRFRFNYTLVRRSREFTPLPEARRDGVHEFGSFTFTYDRTF